MLKHLLHPPSYQFSQVISAKYCHAASKHSRRTFKEEIQNRFAEAARSVLIKAPSVAYNNLIDQISRNGTYRIKTIYSHETLTNNYYLVEYANISAVSEFLLNDSKSLTSTRSRFLKYDYKGPAKKRNYFGLSRPNARKEISNSSVDKHMKSDDQIQMMFKENTISDLSYRLRFLTALQVEEALKAFFPHARVLPFGSSVNGLGRLKSDLDMVVMLNEDDQLAKNNLRFITKALKDNNANKNNLYLLSNIMKNWLPGISDVDSIFGARVPIIKYKQNITNLACDLSINNISGHQMSDIMFTLGQMDDRARPFIFFIRRWAEECGVIRNIQPSPHITNFMLTCMVIFFLQQLKEPVLPPIKAFLPNSDGTNGLNGKQFVTDTSKLNFTSKNSDSMHSLLVEFFTYYSTFRYDKHAINIMDGQTKASKVRDSIYILNPLERSNVSRNVIDYERDKFVEKCKLALKAVSLDQYDASELLATCKSETSAQSKLQDIGEFVSSITVNKPNIISEIEKVKAR